jgi:hypothetical protein
MTPGFESCTLHPAMQPESDAPLVAAPPGAIELIPASGPGGPGPLAAVFRGRSRDVSVAVADYKAALEEWVAEHPEDYTGLVVLGELNVRVGLNGAARELLYRASLLKPPSWEAYQRTSLLLRRAEAELTHEVVRTPGAPPPRWVRQALRTIADQIRRAVTRSRLSRPATPA